MRGGHFWSALGGTTNGALSEQSSAGANDEERACSWPHQLCLRVGNWHFGLPPAAAMCSSCTPFVIACECTVEAVR